MAKSLLDLANLWRITKLVPAGYSIDWWASDLLEELAARMKSVSFVKL